MPYASPLRVRLAQRRLGGGPGRDQGEAYGAEILSRGRVVPYASPSLLDDLRSFTRPPTRDQGEAYGVEILSCGR